MYAVLWSECWCLTANCNNGSSSSVIYNIISVNENDVKCRLAIVIRQFAASTRDIVERRFFRSLHFLDKNDLNCLRGECRAVAAAATMAA